MSFRPCPHDLLRCPKCHAQPEIFADCDSDENLEEFEKEAIKEISENPGKFGWGFLDDPEFSKLPEPTPNSEEFDEGQSESYPWDDEDTLPMKK